jgi:hypothetical protein
VTGQGLPLVRVRGRRDAEERRWRAAEARRTLGEGQVEVVEELPVAVADWPEPWRGTWEERAAMMTFEGGLPVAQAERRAEERVRLEHARGRPAEAGGQEVNAIAGVASLSQERAPGEARTGDP